MDFLGHSISAAGAEPIAKHLQAIQGFPPPADLKALQSFLGLVNFYRRFIPGAARILLPLTNALRGGKRAKFVWDQAMQEAFLQAKQAVCRATQLSHPDPEAVISLAVDASNTHVGAVLQQAEGSAWRPLAFFSRKLDPAQTKYSAFDRELLAAFLAVRHFCFLLEGRRFTIWTDHKPLTHALHRVSEPWSARQQRQLSFLAEFTADIRHISGSDNLVADALSRPSEITPLGREAMGGLSPLRGVISPLARAASTRQEQAADGSGLPRTGFPPLAGLDYKRLARDQEVCTEVQQMRGSPSLVVRTFTVDGVDLLCDISRGVVRPLVPVSCRK